MAQGGCGAAVDGVLPATAAPLEGNTVSHTLPSDVLHKEQAPPVGQDARENSLCPDLKRGQGPA